MMQSILVRIRALLKKIPFEYVWVLFFALNMCNNARVLYDFHFKHGKLDSADSYLLFVILTEFTLICWAVLFYFSERLGKTHKKALEEVIQRDHDSMNQLQQQHMSDMQMIQQLSTQLDIKISNQPQEIGEPSLAEYLKNSRLTKK